MGHHRGTFIMKSAKRFGVRRFLSSPLCLSAILRRAFFSPAKYRRQSKATNDCRTPNRQKSRQQRIFSHSTSDRRMYLRDLRTPVIFTSFWGLHPFTEDFRGNPDRVLQTMFAPSWKRCSGVKYGLTQQHNNNASS